jgi:hypothetical protein
MSPSVERDVWSGVGQKGNFVILLADGLLQFDWSILFLITDIWDPKFWRGLLMASEMGP